MLAGRRMALAERLAHAVLGFHRQSLRPARSCKKYNLKEREAREPVHWPAGNTTMHSGLNFGMTTNRERIIAMGVPTYAGAGAKMLQSSHDAQESFQHI
jgi:hypothetical protein